MANRADILVAQVVTGSANWDGGGTRYLVPLHSDPLTIYCIYIDSQSDVAFRKSTDGGFSWGAPTVVFTGTTTALSVWYDRWSNISAGLIHLAYTESVTDDTLYRTINTESSDALSTQTTIFAGASTAPGGHLSITRAVGGNVYCKTVIDAGAEGGFYRLPNANVPNGAWDAARTVDEVIATEDNMILLPDYDAADNQDIMAIFWDSSASEISRKLYDDSANTWAETSIATSMTKLSTSTGFPNMAVAMDIANTRHILVAWSAVDTLNADLRCWTVDSGSITEVTNVVQNSTDDQGLCAIGIDLTSGYWHVYYAGKSNGSETWTSSVNLYKKVSTDGGTTWGDETLVTVGASDIRTLMTAPRFNGAPGALWHRNIALDELMYSRAILQPKAQMLVGI